jgi:hypothetical protein
MPAEIPEVGFDDAFEELAKQIAIGAQSADLPEKIDALKALTPYYTQRKKKGERDDPDEDKKPVFAKLMEKIADATPTDRTQ